MRPSIRSLTLWLLVLAAILGGCSNDRNPTAPQPSGWLPADKGIPAGYYNPVDLTSAATLRSTLHTVIDDHLKIPYTSTSTDTWNVVEAADTDPANSGRVLDVYLNASFPKYGEGNLDYNREHVWAKSYGFPDDGASNYPYTDCHHLFICNDSYNSSRNNKPYGTVGGSGTEYPTQAVNGVGGGTGVYPGWSNWADTTYWETWWDRRGDVARALLYMDVRYEGGAHGVTGYAEPNLILTDNLAQIEASNTGANLGTAYMGLLSVVLQWHLDDPVDAKEQARNDAVYAYQGNRNPFIDHPEWVACLFLGSCGGGGDTTPPAAPIGLVATAGTGTVTLNWNDNGEADLAGYTVYRATAAGGPFSALNTTLLANSAYTDNAVTGGTTYWYVVTADDVTGNESAQSTSASATPTSGGGGGTVVWINEFHYDNDGTDTGELVEVCGTAGTSLAGWSVVGYNGSGGAVYLTVNLSGTLPNQLSGFGTASFAFAGMQNGSPDGLALVNASGQVVQFLSYEGTFTAVGGAANGLVSTDIGVSQTGTSAVGWTLQLTGSGTTYSAFTWQPAAAGTPGLVNTGQAFGSVPPPNVAPVAQANGPYAALTAQSIAFSSAGSTDSDGTITAWSWNFGDGATSTTANPSHAYAAAGSYTATLTVTDDDGAQHSDTAPVTITAPNVAPVAQANGPYSGTTGANIAFSSAGSSDSDGTINAWLWNFGDGQTSTAANPTHSYTTAGSYTATLTVTDDDGAQHADTAPVTVTAPALANVWINEFHYDNAGTDSGELVELAGPAGTSLAGWTLLAYNGADGAVYMTKALTGTFANLQAGYGVLSFSWAGLQNGAPDGFALVNASGQVVQFLSYEGTFTATGGAAAGMTSTAIPVAQSEATVKGYSCQLQGTGDRYVEFIWKAGVKATAGKKNTSQTFSTAKAIAFGK
jgi:PKD repeat protein/endonuclease I